MRTAQTKHTAQTRSHRPRAITVFAAAFIAGAAAAVGVNRALDVRLAQSKPRVESEAIFVALRSLPQGAPVTVWDVALRDWPKAMMPASALRASDTFSGHLLKHPLREGQPLLSIQLVPAGQGTQPMTDPMAGPPPASYTQTSGPVAAPAEGDLWSPAEPVKPQSHAPAQPSAPPVVSQVASPSVSPVATQPTGPAPTQPAPAEPTTPEPAIAAAVAPTASPAIPETTAATADVTTAPSADLSAAPSADDVATPDTTTASDTGMPQADDVAAAAEATVADMPEPVAEPAAVAAAEPQPQAGPEATAATDVAPPPAPEAASDVPEPVVAPPAPSLSPAPIAAAPPTPAAPVDRPRPAYSRYLVVPESIAVQADASFAARPVAPQQPAAAATPTGQQTASRSGANAVRPLPSTTTVDRAAQSKTPSGTPGKAPQRHGRQAQPANPGTPANTAPQPRLGAAMFPNLSAGIDAIEGRMRREQPAQEQAPSATPSRPVMVR